MGGIWETGAGIGIVPWLSVFTVKGLGCWCRGGPLREVGLWVNGIIACEKATGESTRMLATAAPHWIQPGSLLIPRNMTHPLLIREGNPDRP